MANRHRQVPVEPDRRLILHGSFHIEAVDRIRAIEHDDRQLAPRGLFHRIGHGRRIRVEARADVLQIDDQGVDALQHRAGRPPRVAVK